MVICHSFLLTFTISGRLYGNMEGSHYPAVLALTSALSWQWAPGIQCTHCYSTARSWTTSRPFATRPCRRPGCWSEQHQTELFHIWNLEISRYQLAGLDDHRCTMRVMLFFGQKSTKLADIAERLITRCIRCCCWWSLPAQPEVGAESGLCLALIFVFVLLSACTAPGPRPKMGETPWFRGTPNGWFIVETHVKIDDLGVPPI
jgi:hypothetical protein